jgi:hypothetical protein
LPAKVNQEGAMSFTASNPSQLFSVVGSAYVAENHGGLGYLPARSEPDPIQIGVAGLWGSLFATVAFSLVGSGHAARAVQIASGALH